MYLNLKKKQRVMKATIAQAESNERNLTISSTGRGHFKIECDYRRKRISTITTNTMAIDDFRSEYGEKKDGRNRMLVGYETLCSEIIWRNTF